MHDSIDLQYSISGIYGDVRIVRFPINYQASEVPFQFRHGGWHSCNSKYRIDRSSDFPDHILLFSLTEGGILEFEDEPPIFLPASSVTWLPAHHKHSYYTRPGYIWELYWLHLAANPHIRLDLIFQDKHFFHISCMEKISIEMEKLLHNRITLSQPFDIETSRISGNIYHILLQESLEKKENFYKEDPLISSIIRDMDTDCTYDWKLSQLSEKYFISIPQLIRRFKTATGISPHAYLMTIRLQQVTSYLQFTNLTIDEISHKTGFSSTSNMITQFRKIYKTTPSNFRKNKSKNEFPI